MTLDGTREVHDRRRALKGGGKTFDRVVAGVDACLEAGLPVNLRTVVDKENIEDFAQLAHFAIDQGWAGHPKFKTQLGRNYELHHCQTNNTRLYTRLSLYEDLRRLVEKDPEILALLPPGVLGGAVPLRRGPASRAPVRRLPGDQDRVGLRRDGRHLPVHRQRRRRPARPWGRSFPPVRWICGGSRSGAAATCRRWKGAEAARASSPAAAAAGPSRRTGGDRIAAPDCRPVKELLGLGCAVYGR